MEKVSYHEFKKRLVELLPADERPIVAFTGLWTVLDAFAGAGKETPQTLLDILIEVTGPRRTLFMPVFTSGYQNGEIDLDTATGYTGMLNNLFLKQPGVIRTRSAFFSFVGLGPDAAEAAQLRPEHAWGDHSFYEWMEKRNAHCLMIGVPKFNVSYLHRLEWLRKEDIACRYLKTFSGTIIYQSQREPLTETLFVRDERTTVENDFSVCAGIFDANGMKSFPLGRGIVSEIGTATIREKLYPLIKANPLIFAANPEGMKSFYGREKTRNIYFQAR